MGGCIKEIAFQGLEGFDGRVPVFFGQIDRTQVVFCGSVIRFDFQGFFKMGLRQVIAESGHVNQTEVVLGQMIAGMELFGLEHFLQGVCIASLPHVGFTEFPRGFCLGPLFFLAACTGEQADHENQSQYPHASPNSHLPDLRYKKVHGLLCTDYFV